MNKYVVTYSTGEYDDYRYCVEPIYYSGTDAGKMVAKAIMGVSWD